MRYTRRYVLTTCLYSARLRLSIGLLLRATRCSSARRYCAPAACRRTVALAAAGVGAGVQNASRNKPANTAKRGEAPAKGLWKMVCSATAVPWRFYPIVRIPSDGEEVV